MAYSSGYWTNSSENYGLEDAQRDKLDLVCRKIGLRPGMRLLDVGCGWGSLSLHAAQHYGAEVVGVTLSGEQKAFIDARIRERGLEGHVEIRIQDYREIPDGPFDAVASLEMGEHVGQRNYPVYAAALFNNVTPGGRVLVQQMSRRGRHPGGGPFIESFIAPDMHMRPVGETLGFLEDAGLEIEGVQGMRRDYVRTLEAWYARFEDNHDAAVAMMGEETARVWRLYLVGHCAASPSAGWAWSRSSAAGRRPALSGRTPAVWRSRPHRRTPTGARLLRVPGHYIQCLTALRRGAAPVEHAVCRATRRELNCAKGTPQPVDFVRQNGGNRTF